MTQLKALIFDVDGTLADTERDGHRVAFNAAFKEAGFDWFWDEDLYGKLIEVTGGKERIEFFLNEYLPDFVPEKDRDDFVLELHKLKIKHYTALLSQGVIPLRVGVKRLLSEAREKNLRLAISTTSALPNVEALLVSTIDKSWFEVIAAGDVVEQKKPAPDIYFYVLEKLGLKAEECLVFEDSYQGLVAAKAAGLKTIVTVNNYTKTQDFSGAALVVDCLGEPDRPFEVLAGDSRGFDYVNLEFLENF
ncbi:HAD family hydrolase [Ancylothrix sp. C2]|uniref:HAD family hydrolase n=1 Tax=Ancylothrix sp. D3o TaxID=2953691 RepID=UPI0021BAAC80|nr:HAD family hydrolase [Ancylothrix sp. D3o]MCT7951212.1 HAD family hydrolase [Ancylothrix sp. D3o]